MAKKTRCHHVRFLFNILVLWQAEMFGNTSWFGLCKFFDSFEFFTFSVRYSVAFQFHIDIEFRTCTEIIRNSTHRIFYTGVSYFVDRNISYFLFFENATHNGNFAFVQSVIALNNPYRHIGISIKKKLKIARTPQAGRDVIVATRRRE